MFLRRRSSRLASLDEDPLAIQQQEQNISHKNIVHSPLVYQTPTKKLKEASEGTPLNRRKSILKSATTKMGKQKDLLINNIMVINT